MDFIDLKTQQARLKTDIDARLAAVLAHGHYVLGPEVAEFETALARLAGADFALSCANGTDAIILSLMALGIGPGDAVFCPSFTYCATAEAIAVVGAVPVFVDIDPVTYNMDARSLSAAIKSIQDGNDLAAKAVMAVDLFGQCADYSAIAPVARGAGLALIADNAQGYGASIGGVQPAHWADLVTTSFFPAKPLGCYGDGGAVMTNDKALAETIKSLRNHGQGKDKYDNVRIGLNSRLDTIQAAILLSKLTIFESEIKARGEIAARYSHLLASNFIKVPQLAPGVVSNWAQYTVELDDPEELAAALGKKNIPAARYYPVPIHLQQAYRHYPCAPGGLPHTERAMKRVISLPMHAYLGKPDQDLIIAAIKDSAAAKV